MQKNLELNIELLEKLNYAIVQYFFIYIVINHLALPARIHQVAVLQYLQMVRDGRLGHLLKGLANLGDTHLMPLEHLQDLLPGGIR